VDDNVDHTGDDHVEVVGGVSFAIEVLAGGDRPAGTERVERGELGVVERRERRSVHHEWSVSAGCFPGTGQLRLLIGEAFGMVELEPELGELLAIE
jgi:hypothetical protein